MKIGIIGSGVVGKALTTGFIHHGYEVMAGSRQPKKLEAWKTEISAKLRVGDFAETAAFGDALVLATKGTAAEQAIKLAGTGNFAGKTVLDTTNPIADTEPVNGVISFFTKADESLMERLQKAVPDANFVKVFNSVGAHLMVNPDYESRPTMFICGNSETARADVKKIVDQFGWDVEDLGMAEAARAIESLCILWCIPGFRENRWTHAFKVLKK
ncbi:MAG: NADPH-dependent F420 reductase [Calditrichaceae bacterium]